MNKLLEVVCNLRTLHDNYKKKIEGFDKSYDDLKNILTKAGNYVNSQKVVFIGRDGSNKNDIISELKNLTMANINSMHDKFIDNLYHEGYSNKSKKSSNYKCSNHSKSEPYLKLCLSKSLTALLDKITIYDTPYYNYSDKLDNQIVEECKNANIFVLVLSAVGSMGDQDKKFLTRIFNKVFVKRLIVIFTNIENVPDRELTRTKKQHESNARRIANEVLCVKQTNIPIFFVRNNQLDIEKFLSALDNLTLGEEENNCKCIVASLKETIKNEKMRIFKENKTLCLKTIENEKITENVTTECVELIKRWRNIKDLFEKKGEKKKSFPATSKSICMKRKESIKNKVESIIMKIKESENKSESDKNAIIDHIRKITEKFDQLFDCLLHFNKKFDIDQFRLLPEYFDYSIDIFVREPFRLVSNLLFGFESELFLILSYYKRNKWHIIFKHTVETRQKRKSTLRDVILNITRSNMRIEKILNDSNNVTEPICNQNDLVDNSDEILKQMLENIEIMIEFDWNEIFDKAR